MQLELLFNAGCMLNIGYILTKRKKGKTFWKKNYFFYFFIFRHCHFNINKLDPLFLKKHHQPSTIITPIFIYVNSQLSFVLPFKPFLFIDKWCIDKL